MSIEVEIRHVSGVTILDVKGRLVIGSEGETLRNLMLRSYEQGNRWMLLNCAGIEYVDSSGLGDLVSAYSTLIRRGGVLRLLNPTERLSDLLELTRLDQLFDIYDDELIALASFTGPSNARTQQKLAKYLDPNS